MPVTIWGARETRSDLVEWACKELAVEYTFVEIDWANNEHKSEKYLQLNPFGQVPAFRDGDLFLTESGAIIAYLADKYAAPGSPHAVDTPEKRATLNRWISFANSTMCDDLWKKKSRVLDVLETVLKKQDFILGDSFSLADISIVAYLGWLPYFVRADEDWKLAARWPMCQAYLERNMARPGVAEVLRLGWLDDPSAWLV